LLTVRDCQLPRNQSKVKVKVNGRHAGIGVFVVRLDCANRANGVSGAMKRIVDETSECKIRLDAAIDVLSLSSARLKDVIFSGPEETVEAAYWALRIARLKFLVARAEYRDVMGRSRSVESPQAARE